MSGLDGRRLLALGDLEGRRRSTGRWWWIAAPAGALGSAAFAARDAGWWGGVHRVPSAALVVAIALAAFVPAMFGAPYRMFWRRDAAILARLPIDGRALWYVAVVRAARAAAIAAAVMAGPIAIAALADGGDARAAAGRIALAGGAMVCTTIGLVPAVCLAAAWLVATGKADALAGSVGAGEVQLPPTTVLGALPGTAISAVVIAVVLAAPWIGDGGDAVGPYALGTVAALSIVAAAVATASAARTYPLAMREVAALDRQIYAHLEIHPPTLVERTIAARLGAGASAVYARHAQLIRRRYPLVILGGAAGALALVIAGVARPHSAWEIVAAIAVAQTFVALFVYRATSREPIELPRLTATLPITPAAVTRARRAYVATWAASWMVLPLIIAVALIAR